MAGASEHSFDLVRDKDELIKLRISEGWSWQEGVAGTQVLMPPKDHPAVKNAWACRFHQYQDRFVPHWIVRDNDPQK